MLVTSYPDCGVCATGAKTLVELRRMGFINKPAVVVLNHMLNPFVREWAQLYPQARVIAASSDGGTGEKRRVFVVRGRE